MIFHAENLGPLRSAEVDLSKRLIVLTGPNNTGKTYLAWSIYGLFQFDPADSSAAFTLLEGLVTESIERRPEDIASELRVALSQRVKESGRFLERCFAADAGSFDDVRLALRTGDFEIPRDAYLFLRATREALLMKQDLTEEARNRFIRQIIIPQMFTRLLGRTRIFPAERIAVNIFAKELALKRVTLIDEILQAGIDRMKEIDPLAMLEQGASRYPWPVRDNLMVANDLAELAKQRSSHQAFADQLEQVILGGSVSVSELGAMRFAPAGMEDRTLGIHVTASVVKSLASLVFYFRHLAKDGDFIIIDEPELNLHPDNQRKIARFLAKVVNRGFKVMVSTHSDYIVRELNHLIMLGNGSEEASTLLDDLKYDRGWTLRPEQVGVYLFGENTAETVPVTETGFEVRTIDREIADQNEVSQKIYNRLFP